MKNSFYKNPASDHGQNDRLKSDNRQNQDESHKKLCRDLIEKGLCGLSEWELENIYLSCEKRPDLYLKTKSVVLHYSKLAENIKNVCTAIITVRDRICHNVRSINSDSKQILDDVKRFTDSYVDLFLLTHHLWRLQWCPSPPSSFVDIHHCKSGDAPLTEVHFDILTYIPLHTPVRCLFTSPLQQGVVNMTSWRGQKPLAMVFAAYHPSGQAQSQLQLQPLQQQLPLLPSQSQTLTTISPPPMSLSLSLLDQTCTITVKQILQANVNNSTDNGRYRNVTITNSNTNVIKDNMIEGKQKLGKDANIDIDIDKGTTTGFEFEFDIFSLHELVQRQQHLDKLKWMEEGEYGDGRGVEIIIDSNDSKNSNNLNNSNISTNNNDNSIQQQPQIPIQLQQPQQHNQRIYSPTAAASLIGRVWRSHCQYRRLKAILRGKERPMKFTLRRVTQIPPAVLRSDQMSVRLSMWWDAPVLRTKISDAELKVFMRDENPQFTATYGVFEVNKVFDIEVNSRSRSRCSSSKGSVMSVGGIGNGNGSCSFIRRQPSFSTDIKDSRDNNNNHRDNRDNGNNNSSGVGVGVDGGGVHLRGIRSFPKNTDRGVPEAIREAFESSLSDRRPPVVAATRAGMKPPSPRQSWTLPWVWLSYVMRMISSSNSSSTGKVQSVNVNVNVNEYPPSESQSQSEKGGPHTHHHHHPSSHPSFSSLLDSMRAVFASVKGRRNWVLPHTGGSISQGMGVVCVGNNGNGNGDGNDRVRDTGLTKNNMMTRSTPVLLPLIMREIKRVNSALSITGNSSRAVGMGMGVGVGVDPKGGGGGRRKNSNSTSSPQVYAFSRACEFGKDISVLLPRCNGYCAVKVVLLEKE
eukprot:gene6242-12636_t